MNVFFSKTALKGGFALSLYLQSVITALDVRHPGGTTYSRFLHWGRVFTT